MIQNFSKVDTRLWRGSRPENAADFAWLYDNGVRSIINLELIFRDETNLSFRLISLPDWEPLPVTMPFLEDKHIHSLLATIRTTIPVIYVHCREGLNRTGLAVAAYRIVEKGEDVDAVIKDMMSYNGFWATADVAYIRSLATRIDEFRAK